MRRLTAIPLSIALFLMAGCAALGLPTADTFNQKMVAGYASVASINSTAASLINQKLMTSADGENVLKTTDTAKAGLDVAAQIHKTDATAAEYKLNAVRTVLTAIQSYLVTKGK